MPFPISKIEALKVAAVLGWAAEDNERAAGGSLTDPHARMLRATAVDLRDLSERLRAWSFASSPD